MHRGITAAGKSSSTAASSAGAPAVAATAVLGECALCGDEMTARSSLDLGCAPNGEHRFCLSCWRSWATAEMDKGPQAIFTRCCGYKCNEILPDDLFLSLLDTKKQRLLSRWFIRSAALGVGRIDSARASRSDAVVAQRACIRVIALFSSSILSHSNLLLCCGLVFLPLSLPPFSFTFQFNHPLPLSLFFPFNSPSPVSPSSHYVDTVPSLRWCASAHCSRVVRYSGGGARDVECQCGTRFCFACGFAESHSPAQCEIVEQWNKKANSDDVRNTQTGAHCDDDQ